MTSKRTDKIIVGSTATDNCLWNIERELMHKYGCDEADRDMSPLRWYINTGRATVEFLRKLYVAKPYMVARRLHQGGSYEEVIKRVKKYIKYDDQIAWDFE